MYIGSQGDKFYIILEGEVGVLIPRNTDADFRKKILFVQEEIQKR